MAISCVVVALGSPGTARAACDLIPSASQTFRSTLGATNKPYAAPGDFVEVGVQLAQCDGASSGLLADAADHDVTIVFTPPNNGPRRVAVLTASCAAAQAKLDACAATVGAGRVKCIDAQSGLALVPRNSISRLSFRFPDADDLLSPDDDDRTPSGSATIAVTAATDPDLPCDLITKPCSAKGGLIACIDDLYAGDGTCAPNLHPTFTHFTALPVPNDYQADCFADAPCTAFAPETRVAVDAAGNLLVPVNWQGILVSTATAPVPRLLRGAIKSPLAFANPPTVSLGSFTPEGAPLPPIFEPQADDTMTDPNVITLFGTADASYTILRVARALGSCGTDPADARCVDSRDCDGNTCILTCVGGSTPPNTPCARNGDCSGGGRCGALFADFRPLVGSGGPLVLPRSVSSGGLCQDAPHQACTAGMCPGGELSNPCVLYAFEARTPVPLEGLAGSEGLFAFSVQEAVADKDLNGDTDKIDLVQTLQDRDTGRQISIGVGGALGRAVTALQQPPFSSPALAAEDDVLAFLEPEAAQGMVTSPQDVNGDGDFFDSVLEVFRLNPNGAATPATDLTGAFATPVAADAAPVINAASLAVSEGTVFFRAPEGGGVPETLTRVSLDSAGAELTGTQGDLSAFSQAAGRGAALSSTGRFVLFETRGAVLPIDINGTVDIYLYDRDTDADGVFDESGATGYELISVDSSENPLSFGSFDAAISPDPRGRYVVFNTNYENVFGSLPGTCANRRDSSVGNCAITILRDRVAGTTEHISMGTLGEAPNGESYPPTVSADGRFVAFASSASNLVGDDTNNCAADYPNANAGSCPDVFVRDRCIAFGQPVVPCTEGTVRVNKRSNGSESTRRVEYNEGTMISADGSTVVFISLDNLNLADVDDGGAAASAYAVDVATGVVDAVSRRTNPDRVTYAAFPAVSGDGRYVVFSSTVSLLPGDPGGSDAFRFDRVTRATQLISATPLGAPGNGPSGPTLISTNGRFVAFYSEASDLLAGDTNQCEINPGHAGLDPCPDVYVYDALTKLVRRASLSTSGEEPNDNPAYGSHISISSDGRTVVTSGIASNLVANDTNGIGDVFMRTLDWTNAATVDRTGDGDIDDTLLGVIDATALVPTATPTWLCPASQVAVTNGKAAFIRPAAAGTTTNAKLPLCPAETPANDRVYLWPGAGAVQDLGLDGRDVALSSNNVAAIDGTGTLQTTPVASVAWTSAGESADTIQFCGETVAFTQTDGSGDPVLRLYEPGVGMLPLSVTGARDVVCNDRLVAFRVDEAVYGASLNGPADADTLDQALEAYDLTRAVCHTLAAPGDCLATTGRAVTPCRFEACDPRAPYRVRGNAVKFLTFECDQGGTTVSGCPGGGTDLNDDGDAGDLVIEVYDVSTGTVTVVGTPADEPTTDPLGGGDTTQGTSTASDDAGTVYVTNGRCIETLATPASCVENAECGPAASCEAGVCKKDHGSCRSSADCSPDLSCDTASARSAITPASPDTDGDGVPDHIDNCPDVSNPSQTDDDHDGVGDAVGCDLAVCGNGTVDYDEECDDAQASNCTAGCTPSCTCAPCGAACAACSNVLADPAKVMVKTRNEAGSLTVKAILTLPAFDQTTPVTVELKDDDPDPIVRTRLAGLPETGRKFLYKAKTDGLRVVQLKAIGAGQWKVAVKAKRWFTFAAANQPAASTRLTLTIGTTCFSRTVTEKID